MYVGLLLTIFVCDEVGGDAKGLANCCSSLCLNSDSFCSLVKNEEYVAVAASPNNTDNKTKYTTENLIL